MDKNFWRDLLILGGLIWLFWPRKKPEPAPEPEQIDPECDTMLHSTVLERGPLYKPGILPEGTCIMGDSFLTGKTFSIGDPFSDKQALDTLELQDIQGEMAKMDFVTFILNNTSSQQQTTDLLDSNPSFGGTFTAGIPIYTGSVIDTSTTVIGDALPAARIMDIDIDETNNIYWFATNGGIWRYNVATNTGKKFTTLGGAGAGNQLPNNDVRYIRLDRTNNVIYAATFGGGIWKYDVTTDTGSIYNAAGGAGFGNQLPHNNCNACDFDQGNLILYVATAGGGVWQYDVGTDTGTVWNAAYAPATGDKLPNDICVGIDIDEVNNLLWVTTTLHGAWRYNVTTDDGKKFTTLTGAANGSQLPTDNCLGVKADPVNSYVWIGTNGNGLWQYNTATDTGAVFNMAGGSGSGDQIAGNVVRRIAVDVTNNIIYCATLFGGWRYDVTNDKGLRYRTTFTVNSGVTVPDNNASSVYWDNTLNIFHLGTNSGDWLLSTVLSAGIQSDEEASGGNSTTGVTYAEITRDFAVNPVEALFLKIFVTTSQQLHNNIVIKNSNVTGGKFNRELQPLQYVNSASKTDKIIEIPLTPALIIDRNSKLTIVLEAGEEVIIIFYFKKQFTSGDKLSQ